MNSDYVNFKKMLGYFVHILRARLENNSESFVGDEPKAGQGYKGQRIRKSYEKFNYFSLGVAMDVSVSASDVFSKACYIQWRDTKCDINIIHNANKTAFDAFQLWDGYAQKNIGQLYPIADLALNSDDDPNQLLKDFYHQFVALLRQSEYWREIKMTPEQLANKLKKAPNIILRGAPGTGKTYLAHQIAANLVTNGATSDYQSFLKTATPEQLKQVGFVQFHPSYDYTDFVAGLRPTTRDGQIGFEAKLGTFGEFCRDARESEQAQLDELSEDVHDNLYKIAYADLAEKIQNEADFTITGQTKRTNKDEPSEYTFTDLKVKDGDITGGKGLAYKNAYNTNYYSLENLKEYRDSDTGWTYGREILNEYLENKIIDEHYDEIVTKKFVFIIDEINRGEISKIFGELFFSIDPEYRGKQGEVTTQYANLLGDNGKFYIPKNVYIIGTMNDIDRSVDTFDFAMRRRFSFVEVLAEDSAKMLTDEAVIARMKRVNDELVSGEIGLTTDYQIGASYFKQLNEKQSTPEELWEEKLKPLFQDYFRGERRSAEMVELLAQAYWGNDDGTDK